MKKNCDIQFDKKTFVPRKKFLYFIIYDGLSRKSVLLLDEFMSCFPFSARLICSKSSDTALMRNFSYVKIHEDINPEYLVFNLPNFRFVLRIVSYRLRSDMDVYRSPILGRKYNLMLNNFKTDLGMKIAKALMDAYYEIDGSSTQVANYTVYKDFIHFRFYRFKIRVNSVEDEDTNVLFDQLGPQVTFRLWRTTEIIDGKEKVVDYNKYIKNNNLL